MTHLKKTVLSATLSLILAPAVLGTAFAAPMPFTPVSVQVTASDGGDLNYPALYTESSWMSLLVPLADLGGSLPDDLSLDAGPLDAGTTITLDGVSQQGEFALLHVTVSRADTGTAIHETAHINVTAGGRTLTTVSIPVIGSASSDISD